jgi:putative OPT family oligopeptide transporter
MGYDLEISRVAILAIAGGLMGVLLMIPLRRALIVKEHGKLPYPEGTACAEVLIAGERGGIHAKTVFQAFGIAFLYKFLMTALRVWQETPGKVIRGYQNAEVRVEVSPELLGVGYIIGPQIAGYLFAGGCLAYVVLMPAIKLFGSSMTEPMFGTTKLIRDMSAGEIRAAFVFYIGAGAVASAGIIALARSLPTILGAFRAGFADNRREPARRRPHHSVRLLLHHRVVADLRPDRQLGQSNLRNDHRVTDRDFRHFPAARLEPDR